MDEIDIVSWSSDWVDKSKSTCLLRPRYCASERCGLKKDASARWEGQVEEFKMSASLRELLGIDGEALEFEWNISQDLRHSRLFRDSRMTCNGTLNLRNSQIGSSCQCSTKVIGQGKETMRSVFRIQKKSRRTRRNSRRDTFPLSWRCKEVVWKIKVPSWRRCSDSRKQVPVFTSASALSCGILRMPERKRNRTLKYGCLKHRTLVPNHSFCESAQYLRSSFELVWAIRFDRRRRGDKKAPPTKENPWTKWYWKAWMHKTETFWYLFQDQLREFCCGWQHFRTSNHCPRRFSSQGFLRSRIVLVPGIGLYEIQDQTWRGWRFWINHTVMPRIQWATSNSQSHSATNNTFSQHIEKKRLASKTPRWTKPTTPWNSWRHDFRRPRAFQWLMNFGRPRKQLAVGRMKAPNSFTRCRVPSALAQGRLWFLTEHPVPTEVPKNPPRQYERSRQRLSGESFETWLEDPSSSGWPSRSVDCNKKCGLYQAKFLLELHKLVI